ncbi:hypothetical protein NPX13_g11426 [Xylaria arbuscula]|uniref:Uncharacterized protein n=1 Tax=Xylaria arbuscula TaxID=114810 RepID=A0A9W8N2R0_9PEZI|nr:hypothetical protein NPX13_g11426 [Xylaria arbuscula]
MAFIGDQRQIDNDEEAATVVFTTGQDNQLIANPNIGSSRATPSWSNKAFFIPATASSSHSVGFTSDPDDTDVSTSGFIFYEDTALHLDQGKSGSLSSLWYVVPTKNARVWSLHWNATTDRSDGHLAVKLRSVAPAKPWVYSSLEGRAGLWLQEPEV